MLVFPVYISFLISRVRPVHSFFEKKSILENPSQIFTNLFFSCLLSLLPSAGFADVPVGAGEVKLFLDIQFVQEVSCSAELVHHEEDVADIHADTSLKVRLEHHVA